MLAGSIPMTIDLMVEDGKEKEEKGRTRVFRDQRSLMVSEWYQNEALAAG